MKKVIFQKKTVVIKQCYRECPFWETSMDGMQCGHPSFNEELKKDTYANMIITQSNSRGRVPDECPLRKRDLIMKTTIKYREK